MILHHPSPENPSTLSRAWVVDTESLSLARITVSRKLRLKVEALRPLDPDAPHISAALEPFSPSILASRILKNLREHLHPAIKLHQVTVIEQRGENVPEYIDFYELDGSGISIMRTSEPMFLADHDGHDWITPRAYRYRIDISGEGWAYFFTDAYEELLELNARSESDPAMPKQSGGSTHAFAHSARR